MVPRRRSRVDPPPADCPLDECMRLIGGAWTVNIIWYLREHPRRFSELKADLRGVSAKTLTARLRRLEADGLVAREVKPTSPPTVEYELTGFGRRLLPAIEGIVAVGHEIKRLRDPGDAPGSEFLTDQSQTPSVAP
ncbi:MAG: winged helix-turn-helix transcriptional regulator [Phycisphaerales bacterium]